MVTVNNMKGENIREKGEEKGKDMFLLTSLLSPFVGRGSQWGNGTHPIPVWLKNSEGEKGKKMNDNHIPDKNEIKSEVENAYGAVLPNRISMASEGVITLSCKHSFIPLSPERILQSNLRDKATYAISFKCGDFSFASSTLSSKVSRGISSSSFLMKEKTRMNSSLENSVNLRGF